MNYELSNIQSPADGNNNDTITSGDTDPRSSSDNVSHGSSSSITTSNSLDGQRDTTSSIDTGIDTNESTLSPIHMINSPSTVDMVHVDNVESMERSQQSSINQSPPATTTTIPSESPGLRPTQSVRRMLPIESARVFGTNSRRTLRGIWNSNTSPFFATLVCCLNFSTICRFSISTYFLKGSFIIQFMVISICFGLPFLLFLMSLGQYLGTGYMDMWFISPVFKGIGIAFMIIYGTIAIYTVVPTSWLLVYLRDSFLTTRDTPYKWSYCNRRFNGERCLKAWNSSASFSDQTHLGWSVSAYFHNSVMGHQDNGSSSTYAKLNVIMNLALLWILTFVILFRGLHNAGRVISFLAVFPLVLFIFVNIRFIEEFGDGIIYLFFSNGKTFLGDSLSWILAARECFMVWTLFGGVIINVYGHSRPTNLLRHTITLFIIITVILISSACFFASTIQIIISSNLQYIFSSFEKYSLVNFVRDGSKTGSSEPAHLETASNLLLGENLLDSTDAKSFESNYQVLRWATEIMPIALAIKGPKEISSFWAMTFYLSGVLMNFASHLVLWGSFVDSVIALAPNSLRQTKSTVIFITSFLGFAASVSINSWKNLHIVYFLDSCIGSICWISCLYLVLVVAILVIRGKPCAPYHLVSSLTIDNKLINWLLPTLTLHWTLMLPIILMVLSIFFTRSYRGLNLSWSQVIDDYPYWTPSIRLAWNILQTIPLSVVLIYLPLRLLFMLCMDRDQPIATRLRNLFLPDVVIFEPELTYGHHMGQISTIDQSVPLPDPPPKYSPPPSYSSATSKPLAKQFRANRLASSITIDLHFLRETDANGDHSEKLPRKKSCLRRKSSNKL